MKTKTGTVSFPFDALVYIFVFPVVEKDRVVNIKKHEKSKMWVVSSLMISTSLSFSRSTGSLRNRKTADYELNSLILKQFRIIFQCSESQNYCHYQPAAGDTYDNFS